MPCTTPLTGFRNLSTGKLGMITYRADNPLFKNNSNKQYSHNPITVACGQCMGCRLSRSRMWGARCYHESLYHEDNSFVTLTYSPEHLPQDAQLQVRDHQLFMKRFRKKYGKNIKYFMCGEYGDLTARPHYHYCMFNFDDHEKKYWKKSFDSSTYYISETLTKIWGKGHVVITPLTFETCAYVARYCTKKMNGALAPEHYRRFTEDGEVYYQNKEFSCMSKGIGYQYFLNHKNEMFPDDFIVINNKKMPVPKFYTTKYEITDPIKCQIVKDKRKTAQIKQLKGSEASPERLEVKEFITLEKIRLLKRHKACQS